MSEKNGRSRNICVALKATANKYKLDEVKKQKTYSIQLTCNNHSNLKKIKRRETFTRLSMRKRLILTVERKKQW